jgi:hypothetical protein
MARRKRNSERQARLEIKLNSAELTALDDWRFAMRMPSRVEAIRALLRRGMLARREDEQDG